MYRVFFELILQSTSGDSIYGEKINWKIRNKSFFITRFLIFKKKMILNYSSGTPAFDYVSTQPISPVEIHFCSCLCL